MQTKIKTICVYCGSALGKEKIYQQAAQLLGKKLAQHKINLVYGGGSKGLMGIVAKATQENGGKVTGIIPNFLIDKEAEREDLFQLDEVIITETMHQRKYKMFSHADAFIALPGGIGTLEELIEMLTWAQLGQHQKPIVIVNINNFWTPLLKLFKHMQSQCFLQNWGKKEPIVLSSIEEVITFLTSESLASDE